MNKEEMKTVIATSVGCTFVILLIYALVNGAPSSNHLLTLLKPFSIGITISTLFWMFHISIGWRWPLLNLVFYRPDINGTWVGTLISDWKNEQGESTPVKSIAIVVRQSFVRTHFTTFTEESISVSYAERFLVDKSEGQKTVSYLYRKDTSQSAQANAQDGATELRLCDSGLKRSLTGKYFSSQKTAGTIEVSFRSNKHVDTFDEAMALP